MTTLTDFLLARIAEDEEGARSMPEHYAPFEREWEWCPAAAATDPVGDPTSGVCNCHQPDRRKRALAECEAKRRIMEWAVLPEDEPVLYFLALPYADHPDCREEWKP